MFRLLFFLLVSTQISRAASPSLVIIDPGHGGQDSGGSGYGVMEKHLTLDTALRLRQKLEKAGVGTVMTRSNDTFVELDDRVSMANRYIGKDAVLVSIHYNASGSDASGLETFFWRPDATALAVRIQNNVAWSADLRNIAINRRRMRLTRNPEIPSVLVEGGFMTNAKESRRLADPNVRDRIAQGICKGILELRAKGDSGITRVPEIASAMSRATDSKENGQRIHP